MKKINLSCCLLQNKKNYTLNQRIIFLKQLHLILGSGIPILKGMTLLKDRVDKRTVPICQKLLFNLQSGKNLAQSMRKCPQFFPQLIITLVAAGEQSGELQSILASLVQYYSRLKEFKGFFLKTAIYPMFILLSAIAVLLFFLLYVLPILSNAYIAMQARPSAILTTVLQISYFLKTYYTVVICIALCIFFIIYKASTSILKLFLKIPWCKRSYSLFLEIRFCRLLALLLNSGVNVTDAVTIASASITDVNMLPKLKLVKSYLKKGIDIPTVVEHSLGIFSPLTQELVILGAATGYLPKMLEEAAKIAEEDLQERITKMRELLAPSLLLLAAILTAGIICTVIGPLFDLFTAIPE